jgi:hypothetical protein
MGTRMGVRFECPNGHKLNVKAHLAGERGICPDCGARFIVPSFSGGRVEEAASANDSAVALEMSFSDAPGFKSGAGSAVDAEVAWYVRPTSGGQFGPVDTNEFKQWVADGRVAATAWVWRTGWADWKSGAEALQTFAPEKPRAPTPPPPPLAPRSPATPAPRAPVTPPVAAAPKPQAEPTFDLGDDWPPAVTSNRVELATQPDGLAAARRRQRQMNQRLTLILGAVAMILLVVLVIVLSRPAETATETPESPGATPTIPGPAGEAAAAPAAESTPAEDAAETP